MKDIHKNAILHDRKILRNIDKIHMNRDHKYRKILPDIDRFEL